MTDEDPFDESPVIFRYSRAQAIAHGVLIDLTAWARETGFTISVACTNAVWTGYVVPPEITMQLGQSERGRAHDLLWMLWNAIKRRGGDEDQLLFEVIFLQEPEKPVTAQLKAICGPGDEGEPVLTIMLPDED